MSPELLLHKYGLVAVFVGTFLEGETILVIIGISKISTAKFLIYEAITCVIWAAVISTAGYFFGEAVERVLGRAAHVEKWGLLLLLVIGAAVWGYHQWKDRREAAAPEE